MSQCVIYTRFSPRPDAADSESCDFQRAKCMDEFNEFLDYLTSYED